MGNGNREILYRALDTLVEGLRPFVEARMRKAFGNAWEGEVEGSTSDALVLLQTISYKWNEAFQDSMSEDARNLAFELQEVRHRVMAFEDFTDPDTWRALDSMEKLLGLAGATQEVMRIRELKNSGRCTQGKETGSRTGGSLVGNGNREIVYRAFDPLVEGLRPFVEARMRKAFGKAWEAEVKGSIRDPEVLLETISYKWNEAFQDTMSKDARNLAFELQEVRHRCMHFNVFTDEDTWRALDSMERLLKFAGATQQATAVHELKNSLGLFPGGGWSPGLVEEDYSWQATSRYSARISRQDPGCIIFLIDQSGSMEEPMGGSDYPKCVQVARLINDLLREIGLRCKKEDGVRDYFHVGVIGYSGSSASSALQFLDRTELLDGSELLAELILPISRIADNPVRVEELSELASDGRGGHFVQKVIRPVWLEPKAEGRTPMCEALRLAYRAVSQWIKLHRNSFPPIVINITDGTSTDGDPQEIANDLRSLRTSDGAALLFNIHISRSVAHRPILFPSSDEHLPGPPAKKLFAMSSILPESMRRAASQLGYSVDERSRGFAFNGDLTAVIHFLDIGTQATRLV